MLDPKMALINLMSEAILSTDEFNAEARKHFDLIKRTVEAPPKIKSYLPRLILVSSDSGKDRIVTVIALPDIPPTAGERRELMRQLGVAAAANNLKVLMAIFQCEAWISKLKPEEWEKDKRLPSERPDREEAITMVASSIDLRQALGQFPIIGRDVDENLVLGEGDFTAFNDEMGTKVKDSLLGSFFEAYTTATLSIFLVGKLEENGESVPEEVKRAVENIKACPINLRESNIEEVKKAFEEKQKPQKPETN